MKKIAIIGANEFQDPLIRKAREMGYETHVFAWAAGDVGEASADVFHPISIVEKEAIWQVCRELGVEACCSIGSDLATHTVNYIQRRLGNPCNPEITDRIATNKYDMRRALSAAGVPCPRFLEADSMPTEETLSGFRWPLIVKPTDRSGSRGIFRVETRSELRAALDEAMSQSFEKRAIVEEFIEGREYSCESISFDGEHHILALTKKYTTGAPHFIETGHDEPSDLPPAQQEVAKDQIRRALDALQIRFGASHAEFRITPDGEVRIIEIGARMGGDCIGSDLVYLSTGMDFTAMVIDVACGRKPDLTPKRAPRPASIRFLFTQSDLAALETLRRTAPETIWRESVDDSSLLTQEVTDSSNRHGYYITTGDRPKNRRLLLLGGSNSIDDIRRFAAENNITLIATAHPRYGMTPLKRIADEAYDVNAIDDEGLIRLIREKQIDGIFPGNNEDILPHAIAAAEACGLPVYCTAEMWDRCANKARFKQMCRESGIPVAKTYDLSVTAPEDIPCPVAVKPADSSGSQGFSICRSADEIPSAVARALPFSRTQTVLVEEYIPYDSCIIHYTLVGGKAVFCGISDKVSMLLAEGSGSVMALQRFPSADTDAYLTTLDERVQAMFRRAGMHDGPVWIEAFNNHGQFIFNEMGYRFGGSMTYYPIRYFYGIDQLEFMLRYALGETLVLTGQHSLIRTDVPAGKHFAILPLHVHSGVIHSVEGEDEVASMPDVYAYVPIHGAGDTIRASASVQQVFCYLHLLYDDMTDLAQTAERVFHTLRVTDAQGGNLLFRLFRF